MFHHFLLKQPALCCEYNYNVLFSVSKYKPDLAVRGVIHSLIVFHSTTRAV